MGLTLPSVKGARPQVLADRDCNRDRRNSADHRFVSFHSILLILPSRHFLPSQRWQTIPHLALSHKQLRSRSTFCTWTRRRVNPFVVRLHPGHDTLRICH